MDKTYEKYLRSGIRLDALGLERSENGTPYFCTPKGASIIGWTGVDGIHYCFVRGFGGMVFAVSPMNRAPNFVHPVARTFEDFLRLLLACGAEAALEQAWMWDESEFNQFLQDNPPTDEQKETMEQVAKRFQLTPMEHPWSYLKDLQSSFDYSTIPYTEDYYDPDMNPDQDPNQEPEPPAWEVRFEGGFWGGDRRQKPGTEIPIGVDFTWADHSWKVLSAYVCSKGIVLDIAMQADPEKIRAFTEKWHLDQEDDAYTANLTLAQRMQMIRENPLELDHRATLTLNGQVQRNCSGSGAAYNPCIPEGQHVDWEAKWVVDHYGLDPAYGWMFRRWSFPWTTKRKPVIKTLSITLEKEADRIPGSRFQVHQAGDTVSLTHPETGTEYTLTVQELERETMPERAFGGGGWAYPTHLVVLSYSFTPEPEEQIQIQDADEGDSPRPMAPPQPAEPTATGSVGVIGIIGGADGPVVMSVGRRAGGSKLRTACSGLHFDPIVPADVTWYPEFWVTRYSPITIQLL